MAVYGIVYVPGPGTEALTTEVTADLFRDSADGDFIDFYRHDDLGVPVLRVRSDLVLQITRSP